MQIKKTEKNWKIFYSFCKMRSLINKLMIRQSYDCVRFSGTGTLYSLNSYDIISAPADTDLIKVSLGRGCPFKWFRCVKYCESYMFQGGFCLKKACVCLPNGYNVLR